VSHNIGEKGTVMIEIQNLTKVFQEQTVLQNINATFDAGLIHGVIGKNGAGKSSERSFLTALVRFVRKV
jgi:ABC-type multidrug transport system ATPase subunit